MRPRLVGIAGGSGSGKSRLARAIAERLRDARVVELDWYYQDLSHLEPAERCRSNFDHPDALDWPLMLEHLQRLAAGESIAAPVYDFSTHTRSADARKFGPAQVMVVEGILALHHEEVRRALDLSIFVAAPEAVRLARRLERDVKERGRTPASVHEQFEQTVRPMHEAYVEPSCAHAQLIADGERDFGPAVKQTLALLGLRAQW